ncbi:MAG TPA: hypothetical protein VM427_02270 [Patescibacteria group bacterium]|nr:hypothetical protein [Patescibacteria group bacterium]
MELIVGALVVLGFLAILIRLVPRDAAGRATLPAIVDDSIGMWALRRLTGRPLWERPWDDEADPVGLLPGLAADGRAASAPAASAHERGDVPMGPPRVAPVRYVVSRSPGHALPAMSPILTPPVSHRNQTRRRRLLGIAPSRSALTGIAVAVVAGVAVIGGVLAPRGGRHDGEVLGVTGRPVERSSVAATDPAAAGETPTGVPGSIEPTASVTTIAGPSEASPVPVASGAGRERIPTREPTTAPTAPTATPPPSIATSPSPTPTPPIVPSPSVDPTPSIVPSPSVSPSPLIVPSPSVDPSSPL